MSIKEYSKKIETFLVKNRGKFYSELQIAEKVFGLKLGKDGDIPKSQKQMQKLSDIRNTLKLLMTQKKLIGSLLEDPHTRESMMRYSASR